MTLSKLINRKLISELGLRRLWKDRQGGRKLKVAPTLLLNDVLGNGMNRNPRSTWAWRLYSYWGFKNTWDQHIGLWPGKMFIVVPFSNQMFCSLLLLGHDPDPASACSSWLVPPRDAHAEQPLLLIKGPAEKPAGACTRPPTAHSKPGCELAKCRDRTA